MRRLFRRHIRKTLAQEVPPILQEAHFAFDKGEYGRAGELFERLAGTAAARGSPRAPVYYLQAGRARVLAGQTALGMPSLRRGLELLAQRRQFTRLRESAARVVTELNERRHEHEASEIEAWVNSVLPNATPVAGGAERPGLPTHCPSCGGPVRPEEVEWLDHVTAECAYCGSPMR